MADTCLRLDSGHVSFRPQSKERGQGPHQSNTMYEGTTMATGDKSVKPDTKNRKSTRIEEGSARQGSSNEEIVRSSNTMDAKSGGSSSTSSKGGSKGGGSKGGSKSSG